MYFVLIIVTHYTHYLSSHWKSAHITKTWFGKHDFQQQHTNVLHTILRDPGAVSRVGRKGATKVFKHGQKSPLVPTLAGPFTNGQANAVSWSGIKKALYYCAQSANSISWVLFVSSYTTFIVSITACLHQRNASSQEPRFNGYHKNRSHLLINVIAKCTDQMHDKGAPTCTNGITFIALIFSIKLLLLQKCIEHKRNMRTTWRSKCSCFSLWISLRQSSISPSSRESKLNADSHLILQLYLIIRYGGKYCIHVGNDSTFIGGEARGVVREITQNEATMLWSDWLLASHSDVLRRSSRNHSWGRNDCATNA